MMVVVVGHTECTSKEGGDGCSDRKEVEQQSEHAMGRITTLYHLRLMAIRPLLKEGRHKRYNKGTSGSVPGIKNVACNTRQEKVTELKHSGGSLALQKCRKPKGHAIKSIRTLEKARK